MAIKTVSNTGGLWSSAATWVGGVIPNVTGKDSIAFTATSGPLIVDQLAQTTVRGINFTNYVNTITFKGQSIFIDDTNTAGRSFFINLGTGGYTVVCRDPDTNAIIPNNQSLVGLVINPQLSQLGTLTSGGVTWPAYFEINPTDSTTQTMTLVGNWVTSGIYWMSQFSQAILKNNRMIFNGNPLIDVFIDPDPQIPPFYTYTFLSFYQCTTVIEINSPNLELDGLLFDGTRLEINSPSCIIHFGGLNLSNSLGSASTVIINCSVTMPDGGSAITSGQFFPNNLALTVVGSIPSIELYTAAVCNISGDITNQSNATGNSVLMSGSAAQTITVGGSITGNISANTTNTIALTAASLSTTDCLLQSSSTITFNIPIVTALNLFLEGSTLTIGAFSSFNVTDSITLITSLAGSTIAMSFPALNLASSFIVTAPITNVTFAGLTSDVVVITSSTSGTIDLGSTAGAITTFNMTTPIAVINKNNCAITTSTLTVGTSVTFNGGANNSFGTLNTTSPLLILDAENCMNSSTIINLTTNTTRTIQLTSAMNVASIIGLAANTSNLTFTGSFGATIANLNRFGVLRFTVGNTYLITNRFEVLSCAISSVTPGTKATLNLGPACTNLLVNVSLTDIDASLTPRGIHTYYGTVNNCTNVRRFADNTIPQATHTF